MLTAVLCRNKPYRKLLRKQLRSSGRNNRGVITVRHHGGSHKRRYRKVEFSSARLALRGLIERVEYDPNRTAHIALVLQPSGTRTYIIAPRGLSAGATISNPSTAPITPGTCLALHQMAAGTRIHCLELTPTGGAKLTRAAGTFAILLAAQGIFVKVKLQSGEVRLVNRNCTAIVGEVGNAKHNQAKHHKAGNSRWRGIRPTVRGVAMNPIDHPHGGGEGKTAAGRDPVSPWGTPTKGHKTRKIGNSNRMIVARRNS